MRLSIVSQVTDSADRVGPRRGKRERLAEAAAQVFHEQGVEKTTLTDIARAADVPVGNVYYYFKTKDELVGAAQRRVRDARALEQPACQLHHRADARTHDGVSRCLEICSCRFDVWCHGSPFER